MAYSTSEGADYPIVVDNVSEADTDWSPGLDLDDLRELQAAQQDPTKIVAKLPREASRMGYYATICLIFNRMIGTGIFNSPSVVFTNTQSIGLSLILWAIGGIMALAGVIVYIELGLTIPRWPLGSDGTKISTPRSGDVLNYFNYMLKRPLFLATCMFGIIFIILENTAGTSVSFAQSILTAAHTKQTPGKIIAIALSANTFCCLLHAVSRKWGIILNTFLGTVKLLLLLFIIIIGFVWLNRDTANHNFDSKTAFIFDNSPKLPYRYAEAMLYIILPYGAFHQINYVRFTTLHQVISELREPRKTFPRASFIGVLTIVIIYTTLNILFAAIIPKSELFKLPGGIDVGQRFFDLTLGHVVKNENHLITFYAIIKVISTGGNLIVVTFTTARVKQEIAKEGILPYSLLFAENYDISWDRLRGRTSPSSERTPAATLALHWIITTILVVIPVLAIQPVPYSSTAAYSYLTTAFVYNINLVIFTVVAFGLLCLRFTPNVHWAQKSSLKYPLLSIIAALILLIVNIFPLIFLWVPDPSFPKATHTGGAVDWFAGQTFALCLLAFAFLYWVIFRAVISVRSRREGKVLHVRRKPIFKHDARGLTQVMEIVSLEWKREVGMRLDEVVDDEGGFVGSSTVSMPAWERASEVGKGAASVHEIGQQRTVRRKPVMSELLGSVE
ncbi:uncharacterized protein LY89DRAFT_598930 [Mollisia scopiformis]|uniref:High-affinity methionine permease n=1 Tax=Mollisia scopiformis TaxID=149040 RepID=A0A132BBH5_MOLSC|nr:uncharacterized protein LY89DRAFT_598930 [Mollisia scopiformis]KUJ09194.1 hypothetical protein LY89DRAFT_598930 [Mollisia scopiformis]